MIAYLQGTIFKKEPGKIILLADKVGYEVFISLQTFKKLKAQGEQGELFIHTVHKEDVFQLYGFHTENEKDFFKILISISGIGPKVALAILSHFEIDLLKKAIVQKDSDLLTKIGGIGKKRAEKLIFELKEKIEDISSGPGESSLRRDLIQALENLGYSPSEAREMIDKTKLDPAMTIEEALKNVLSAK